MWSKADLETPLGRFGRLLLARPKWGKLDAPRMVAHGRLMYRHMDDHPGQFGG